jgi:exodeoxyribonuclease X
MIKIRVIDTETTGLTKSDHVIEAAYHEVISETDHFQVYRLGSFDRSYFSTDRKMHLKARAAHHISPSDLVGAPNTQYVAKFLHWPEAPNYFAAHNASFDFQFIETRVPVICTLACARNAWKDAPAHTNQVLRYFLDLDSDPNFDRERAMPPHRALPDTYVTALILMRLLESFPVDQLVAWSGNVSTSNEIRHLPFGEHKGVPLEQVPLKYLNWVATASSATATIKEACAAEASRRGLTGLR